MEHFAGLDVSVKETSVCIVDDTGRIVKEVKAASEPRALLKILGAPAYRFKRIRLEAGPLSQWLFSGLAEAGLPVCVETRHMQAVLKAQINKTDRNDARGIAQMMRAGLSSPASDRSWLGAPKRSTPCLRNPTAQARRYRQELVPRSGTISAVRSCFGRNGRAASRGATCQPAAVPDRHGGLRRRASSQPQAAGAWAPSTAHACEIRAPVFEETEERLPRRRGDRRSCAAPNHEVRGDQNRRPARPAGAALRA
jgi:hypothetical protein